MSNAPAGANAGIAWPGLLAAYAALAVERGLPQASEVVARARDAHRGILGAAHPATRRIEAPLAISSRTCAADSFCRDASLTRGQMAAFPAKALGLHWPY